MEPSLVEQFYAIVDGYYVKSEYFNNVEKALKLYEETFTAVKKFSIARDGWEMIESALREMELEDDEGGD